MGVKVDKNNDVLDIVLDGRLDTTNAPQVESEIGKITDDIKKVNIDLSDLSYIASSGLRVLLSILKQVKKNGGTVVLQNPSEPIYEILETTGFTDIFTIEK